MCVSGDIQIDRTLGPWVAYGIALYEVIVPELRKIVKDEPTTTMNTAVLLDKILQAENLQLLQKIKEYYHSWSNGRFEEFFSKGEQCFSDLLLLLPTVKRDLPKDKVQKLVHLRKYGLYLDLNTIPCMYI